MARKKAESIEDIRQDVKKRYRQGTKKHRELVNWNSLTEAEKWLMQERACLLKAAGFSYTYIAEAVASTRGVVKGWFEQPAMQTRVAEFQKDFIDGAVKLVKTYAIEIFEMLMDIARDGTIDPKVRIQAMTELLDRMGLAKVNKSESAVTKKSEVDITDKTGLMAAMTDAPPEVQQEMAAKLEEAFALAAEHTDRDVTHQ
jgi:hypothetical protein